MIDVLLAVCLLVLLIVLAVVLLKRQPGSSAVDFRLDAIERGQEKLERGLRQEIAQNRSEAAGQGKDLREEVASSLKAFNDSVLQQLAEFHSQQRLQTEALDVQGQRIRATLDERLQALQSDNNTKLEQMRHTVDEKLQGTLERRLGESFQLVSERLEQVYKGLGEMQSLATGVGDLKKVLSNVKTRGTWGEVQLGNLLEQMLAPDQYARNVATKGGSERVEFAIKLPGPEEESQVWLPVDAKFPQEDYQRLIEASERGDGLAVEEATVQLERSVKRCAKDICEKYLAPPKTTDFAILFLPTEGLYAEVLRRTGLAECLQRDYRVTVSGPMTFSAILNSLQMGFRTLAVQERSSEVSRVLASVKTEFSRYAVLLDKVEKKLQEASNTVDLAKTRTRAIERQLRDVEVTPEQLLLAVDVETKLLLENDT
ncbi:MAG TPA: DNA recombination protein RmuC [Bryobacteraceae bacterium]|nr:DNA recombination protein RmuC [Bryobacteraceae bacterium]